MKTKREGDLKLCKETAIEVVAPKKFDSFEIKLYVYDGLCWSSEVKTVIRNN